jgi:hypothetical protein
VKWKELSYEECTWESESDILAFRTEIERFQEIQSRRKNSGDKGKSVTREARTFKDSPKFLSGGMQILNHYYSYINFQFTINLMDLLFLECCFGGHSRHSTSLST